ncbi:hypothetical protein A3Q56_02095 [Intoshia linei]|uniref:J domain-containing protein n=1 Tax=Intoshia linei TaxID=1819745 RepID=A0A177B780_9BILA|nr:hypothetical protein A3Q56_02095 [Intoshia linei]
MRCYYEVLGVEPIASTKDIQFAYRKLALKYHPDKNQGSEEFHKIFQELQNAYQILTNEKDRSWYDRNKEQLMYIGTNVDELNFDLYDITNTSQKNFFKITNFIFEQLWKEEKKYRLSTDAANLRSAPSFGNLNSPQIDTENFYNYWTSFISKKSYLWLKDDKYGSKNVCRLFRRKYDREFAKIVNNNRCERNVKLQKFLKTLMKLDQRYQKIKLNKIQLLREKEVLLMEKMEKLKLQNNCHVNNYKEQEWSKPMSDNSVCEDSESMDEKVPETIETNNNVKIETLNIEDVPDFASEPYLSRKKRKNLRKR